MNIWPLGKILSTERSSLPAGEGNSVFSNRVTLGIYVIPGHVSCSGAVDQHIVNSAIFVCFYLI